MAERGQFQRPIVFGLIVIILVVCVHSEKPDTTRILTRHQQYRSLTQASDMTKMTWSVNLEKIAASMVEKCPTSVEDVRSQLKPRNLGANLGSSPYPPPMQDGYPEDIQTSIIDQWGSERSYYYPDSGCASQPCDSWWQIVWSNASQVGCSLRVCGDKTVMICVYSSRANNSADAPFKVGKACSACPYGYSKCEQGMCTADKNAPMEPDFLPAAGGKGGATNDGNNGNDGTDENNGSGYDNEPDTANRVTVLLTASLSLFLLTLLV